MIFHICPIPILLWVLVGLLSFFIYIYAIYLEEKEIKLKIIDLFGILFWLLLMGWVGFFLVLLILLGDKTITFKKKK